MLAYELEVPAPRAVDNTGRTWEWEGPDYVGPPGERSVRIAENGDARWGDRWQADGWANVVTTETGRVRFGPVGVLRSAALAAGAWFAVLLVAAFLFPVVRRRRT